MRLAPWTVAAFLSPATRQRDASSSSSQSMILQPLDNIVVKNGANVVHIMESSMRTSEKTTTSLLEQSLREWLVPSAYAAPPSTENVELLQRAMAAFYGQDMAGKGRDMELAQDLLTKTIAAWKGQPADERAALYRIRGDTYVALGMAKEAIGDFGDAIDLLELPEGDLADPSELPAARLGRARAIRSLGTDSSDQQKQQAAKDYQLALRLSSREDWDTDQEREEDGAQRNPYAAWEWGHSLRAIGDYKGASQAHALASFAFGEIGDRAHSVMSSLDTGIDLASMSKNVEESKSELQKAIKRTQSVEGRDVDLLQRVIAKEGEARIALASVLWSAGDKASAEKQLGDACIRLEELEADAQERLAKPEDKNAPEPTTPSNKLKFSIDDSAGPFQISCSRFTNEKFLAETLEWPAPLRDKVMKLENLN